MGSWLQQHEPQAHTPHSDRCSTTEVHTPALLCCALCEARGAQEWELGGYVVYYGKTLGHLTVPRAQPQRCL